MGTPAVSQDHPLPERHPVGVSDHDRKGGRIQEEEQLKETPESPRHLLVVMKPAGMGDHRRSAAIHPDTQGSPAARGGDGDRRNQPSDRPGLGQARLLRRPTA